MSPAVDAMSMTTILLPRRGDDHSYAHDRIVGVEHGRLAGRDAVGRLVENELETGWRRGDSPRKRVATWMFSLPSALRKAVTPLTGIVLSPIAGSIAGILILAASR